MTTVLDATLSERSLRWQQQGVAVGPGASISDLKEFEARFHVACRHDFAAYLLRVGGMPVPGHWDDHQIRFLPLRDQAGCRRPPSSSQGYFIFADYFLSAHEYAIRLSTHHSDVAIIYPGSRGIAPNFTAFLNLYLENPMLLF